jgi:predicted metalloendopeptidase
MRTQSGPAASISPISPGPEMARLRAATDPHSPARFRVLGPLGNLDAFSKAFQCSERAPMLRRGAERCDVW